MVRGGFTSNGRKNMSRGQPSSVNFFRKKGRLAYGRANMEVSSMMEAVWDRDPKVSSFGSKWFLRWKVEHSSRSVLICLSSFESVSAEKRGPRGLP